jgi:hypothetical protein
VYFVLPVPELEFIFQNLSLLHFFSLERGNATPARRGEERDLLWAYFEVILLLALLVIGEIITWIEWSFGSFRFLLS